MALAGLLGTIITAVATSPIISKIIEAAVSGDQSPKPAVEIVGPDIALLGEGTYYTLVSENAAKAAWSVGGFSSDQPFEIDPLPPSQQIYIEPKDATRAGEAFVIAVAVYNKDGDPVTATKRFTMVWP